MPSTTQKPPRPTTLPDISTIKNFPVDNPRAKPAWKWGGVKQGWYLEVLDRTYYWDPDYVKPNGKKGRGLEIRVHIGRIVDGVFYTDAQYRARFKRGGVKRAFVKPKTRPYHKKSGERVPPIELPSGEPEARPQKEKASEPAAAAPVEMPKPAAAASEQSAATPAAPNESPVPSEPQRLVVAKKELGGTLLCYRVAESIGLVADLQKSYGKTAAAAILSVATHWLMTSRNAAWLYGDWAEQFALPFRAMDAKEMTEFYKGLGADQQALSQLFTSRFARIPETECVSYDSTNAETEAKECSDAILGKGKDGTFRNQICLAVCYANRSRSPLMFRIFPGNVPDTKTTKDLIERLTVFSNRRARTVVLDRGYFSIANLGLWAQQQDYDAIIAAKIGTAWVWDVIENHMPDYWDWKRYLKDEKCYARTDEVSLKDADGKPFTAWVHSFRSDFKSGEETDEFARELADYAKKWEKGTASATSSTLRYFQTPTAGPGECKLVENNEAVQARLRQCGFFACVSTKKMTAAQAVRHYGERDGVEKIFKSGKTELEMDAMRAHLNTTILGRHIVGFVALSIMAALKKGMSEPRKQILPGGEIKEYRPLIEEYSVYQLLQAFSTVHLVQYGSKVAVSEITGKKRLLLSRAGFSDAYSEPLPEYCQPLAAMS